MTPPFAARRLRASIVAAALAVALPGCESEGLPDARLRGSWTGRAHIIVSWCEQETMPVAFTIDGDGAVTGTVGDARLVDGRVSSNRGAIGKALDVKTDFIVVGGLDGPLVAAEDVVREGVKIPCDLVGGVLVGSVHSTGTHVGPASTMVLTAPFEALTREVTDFFDGAEDVEPRRFGSVDRLHAFDGIYFASQPGPEDLRAAKEAGLATVVDLRHPHEAGFDEADVAAEVGLAYVAVPWNGPDELTDDVFDRARERLRSAERPILVHCGSANRVGAIWLAHRVIDYDVPVEQALEEARRIGLRTPAYEAAARDYLSRSRAP